MQQNIRSSTQKLNISSAPYNSIIYFYDDKNPQSRIQSNIDKELVVLIGILSKCSLFDFKFMILLHNAAPGAEKRKI
ncbi:MAG: hypothetical protein KGZ42_05190 [Melioribacter sp.]|nr:hypothetical protein [Melioribacter sp.]